MVKISYFFKYFQRIVVKISYFFKIFNRSWSKHFIFEKFSKTCENVNTLLGPLSGAWKGPVQVMSPEA